MEIRVLRLRLPLTEACLLFAFVATPGIVEVSCQAAPKETKERKTESIRNRQDVTSKLLRGWSENAFRIRRSLVFSSPGEHRRAMLFEAKLFSRHYERIAHREIPAHSWHTAY